MRILILFPVTMLLSACVTPARQTEALLKENLKIPVSHEIKNVPFIDQEIGHCGPATLAMVLQHAGKNISAQQLAEQVYTPGMGGSFQADMISAVRRNGMLGIPIIGMHALLEEVAAGHPVIVFENLALSWYPQWHYAVVLGYDLRTQEVIMHSGPEQLKRWDLAKFERSWMLGDYWGLLVISPNTLSESASEMDHLQAAVGLEQIGKRNEAKEAYQKILSKWPKSLGALVGRANVHFQETKYKSAIKDLKKAVFYHPNSVVALNNLKVAETIFEKSSSKSP